MLFDTNLWSYLGKETDADRTAAVLRATGHRALVNTQMLTEALRTSDVGDRTRIVDMMASRHWLKLTSAMDAHAVEMTSEVRRLRPEWLRSIPKTDRLHSFRAYWTKVYWRDSRTEPEAVLARIAASSVGDDADDAIARVQAANKPGWPFEPGDLLSAALSATTAEDHPDRDPGSGSDGRRTPPCCGGGSTPATSGGRKCAGSSTARSPAIATRPCSTRSASTLTCRRFAGNGSRSTGSPVRHRGVERPPGVVAGHRRGASGG